VLGRNYPGHTLVNQEFISDSLPHKHDDQKRVSREPVRLDLQIFPVKIHYGDIYLHIPDQLYPRR
jgi:hypothetical protein